MRDIKFRAWDKENSIWIQINKMGFWEDGALWYLEGYEKNEPPYFDDRNDWALMQYTGLKDKNGKGIYEGDIVTWFINNKEITAPIYFDDEQASFWMGKDVSGKMGLVLNDWMRGKYEVIGNLFENPELLEEVK